MQSASAMQLVEQFQERNDLPAGTDLRPAALGRRQMVPD